MPEARRVPADQYQGPAYFTYQGKTLKKISCKCLITNYYFGGKIAKGTKWEQKF